MRLWTRIAMGNSGVQCSRTSRRHSSRQPCFAGVAIHSILVMTNITIALWSRARLASGSQMWCHARAAIRRIIQNARKVPPCSIISPSQTTTWALPGYQSPSTDAESSFHSDLDSVYEVLWEARCEDSVYEVLRGRLEIGGWPTGRANGVPSPFIEIEV